MTQSTDEEKIGRALEKLARIHDTSMHKTAFEALCLDTSVGDLCVLVVPNRSEIEVWLASRDNDGELRYPLATLQKALGEDNRAFLYRSSDLDICISNLTSFLGTFLQQARRNPGDLKRNLDHSYNEMVQESLAREKRTSAERLWASGLHRDAANLYEEIPNLTKVERKRLDLFRSGKMPR